MSDAKKLELYVDGASRGNPGFAGIGAYALSEGKVVFELAEFIGETTNNVAEYRALIRGLEEALAKGYAAISVSSDSELLVRQIQGEYKIKADHLIPLLSKARGLISRFSSFSIQSIPREKNKQADRLANLALNLHS